MIQEGVANTGTPVALSVECNGFVRLRFRMSVNVDGETEKAVDSIIERLLAVF